MASNHDNQLSFSDYCKTHPKWKLVKTEEYSIICTLHTPVKLFKSDSDPALNQHLVSFYLSYFFSFSFETNEIDY